MTDHPSPKGERERACHTCQHYRYQGDSSGGTPPWPTCPFQLTANTCGPRYVYREPYSWERRAALQQGERS